MNRAGQGRHGYLFFATSTMILLLLLLLQETVALASPSIPPSLSVPVWSLASPYNNINDSNNDSATSMNIVTFATPVSVAPPKLWAVSLYTNTLTRDAFLESKLGVLQLLTPAMTDVVPLLGKRSGKEAGYSKREACQSVGYPWIRGGGRLDRGEDDEDKLLLNDEEARYVS